MIIITLILALSLKGVLTNAAGSGDSQNSELKLRRLDTTVPRLVHFTDNPSSHSLLRSLLDDHMPIKFEDGSKILRGVQYYGDYCLPKLNKKRIGSFFPRFQDCRTYYVRTTPTYFAMKRCPGNSIFDPTSSSCIFFHRLYYIPYSCLQRCQAGDKLSVTEDTNHGQHVICSKYNPDGTMRITRDCVSVFGDPKYLNLDVTRGTHDSLPTESVEESSTELRHDEHMNFSPKPMPLLNEPLLEDKLGKDQREGRLESEGGLTKVLSDKRNSKTLKSDSQHKSPSTKRSTRKPIGKHDNSHKFVRGSGMNEELGDGLNYSSGEDYFDYSGTIFEVIGDY